MGLAHEAPPRKSFKQGIGFAATVPRLFVGIGLRRNSDWCGTVYYRCRADAAQAADAFAISKRLFCDSHPFCIPGTNVGPVCNSTSLFQLLRLPCPSSSLLQCS